MEAPAYQLVPEDVLDLLSTPSTNGEAFDSLADLLPADLEHKAPPSPTAATEAPTSPSSLEAFGNAAIDQDSSWEDTPDIYELLPEPLQEDAIEWDDATAEGGHASETALCVAIDAWHGAPEASPLFFPSDVDGSSALASTRVAYDGDSGFVHYPTLHAASFALHDGDGDCLMLALLVADEPMQLEPAVPVTTINQHGGHAASPAQLLSSSAIDSSGRASMMAAYDREVASSVASARATSTFERGHVPVRTNRSESTPGGRRAASRSPSTTEPTVSEAMKQSAALVSVAHSSCALSTTAPAKSTTKRQRGPVDLKNSERCKRRRAKMSEETKEHEKQKRKHRDIMRLLRNTRVGLPPSPRRMKLDSRIFDYIRTGELRRLDELLVTYSTVSRKSARQVIVHHCNPAALLELALQHEQVEALHWLVFALDRVFEKTFVSDFLRVAAKKLAHHEWTLLSEIWTRLSSSGFFTFCLASALPHLCFGMVKQQFLEVFAAEYNHVVEDGDQMCVTMTGLGPTRNVTHTDVVECLWSGLDEKLFTEADVRRCFAELYRSRCVKRRRDEDRQRSREDRDGRPLDPLQRGLRDFQDQRRLVEDESLRYLDRADGLLRVYRRMEDEYHRLQCSVMNSAQTPFIVERR